MDRTWTTYLVPRGFAGYEADQVQDLRQRDRGSDLSKVNARHGGDPQVRVFRAYNFAWATLSRAGSKQRRGTRNHVCNVYNILTIMCLSHH